MSPTFEASPSFVREYLRLTRADREAFRVARDRLVEALKKNPPEFPPSLRVKRVQGHSGVWELTWAADGRATFDYGQAQLSGEPHVRWRRIGDHSILHRP